MLSEKFCDQVIHFAASKDRLPASGQKLDSARQLQVTAAAVSRIPLCSAKVVSTEPAFTSTGTRVGQATSVGSAEVDDLLVQVETAIDLAVNSYDLALRLNHVLDQAQSLDELSRAVIGSTVSVAQNSYEYWQADYSTFVQEVASACDLQIRTNPEDSGSPCFNTTYGAQFSRIGEGAATNEIAFDAGDDLRNGFRSIVKADAGGAGAGAWNGFLTGMALGGPAIAFETAVLGAIGAGAGASMVVAAGLAGGEYCASMKWKCGGKK